MKINRLSVTMFLCLYSCATAMQGTNNSIPSPIISIEPTSTITSSPSVEIKVPNSPVPEITPSINSNLDENTISLVVNDEDNIMGKTVTQISTEQGNDYNGQLTLYNMLPNEKKRFRVSLFGSKQVKDENIIWSSSNIEIATVDKNGLVSSINKSSDKELIGSTVIKAYLETNPKISASFPIMLYKELKISSRYNNDNCQNTATESNLSRYQNIDQFVNNYWKNTWGIVKIDGRVYDTNKNLISGAIVTVKDLGNYYKAMDTINGEYIFRNIPICQEFLLTVSKEGYKTKSRRVLPRSIVDETGNIYNFGGDNLSDAIYALEKIEN